MANVPDMTTVRKAPVNVSSISLSGSVAPREAGVVIPGRSGRDPQAMDTYTTAQRHRDPKRAALIDICMRCILR